MNMDAVSAVDLLSALSARGFITPTQLNDFRAVAQSLAASSAPSHAVAAQATSSRAPLVPPSKPASAATDDDCRYRAACCCR